MFVVNGYLRGVRRSVGDFGESAAVGFDRLGGAFIGHFCGCVVSESAFKVVAGVDVLIFWFVC